VTSAHAADRSGLVASLRAAFGESRVGLDVPLAPLTTFRVGGPADVFLEPRSSDDIVKAVSIADTHRAPLTVLGGGSNVLIADSGLRGLVLRPRGGAIVQEAAGRVRADAAVTINGLVRWLIGRGLAGFEAWAGTPGTVGGGVYGNAHWDGRLLSEFVDSIRLVTRKGTVSDVTQAAMEFGYDRSRLQRTGEVLLSAAFIVTPGDPATLREQARRSLAYRKGTQPLASPSAGCIFQNPAPDVPMPREIPRSAGALVDRAGLKGMRVGGALVSPTHGNFIVNTGAATAADIRALIERCRDQVRRQFGVTLAEEIVYLGTFEPGTGETRVDSAH
jgi:UDP-N-acetylmuramate dehydrogenase